MSEIVFQNNRSDAAELGAQLHGAGLRTGSVRSFVEQVRNVAEQVTLTMTPLLLEELRNINQDQFADAYDRIQRLPTKLGHVDRAQVLLILHSVFNTQPGR
jgi:hypothetical protein